MSEEKLKIKIKPFGFLDLIAFKNLVPSRQKKIAAAKTTPPPLSPQVNNLAALLHPEVQHLVVSDVYKETDQVKTYRLVANLARGTKEPAYFRPGQYLSLSFYINGSVVTRPYSISSSPAEALKGFYEITVKKDDGGYVSGYIHKNWEIGSGVTASGPQGQFYYDSLRDSKQIAAIAGGLGVTPFRSMAKSIAAGVLPVQMTLFCGSNSRQEVIFLEELKQLAAASGDSFKVVHVLAEEKAEGFEEGLISAELIQKYIDVKSHSFFVCGPRAMHDYLDGELDKLGIRKKYIRRELFGEIKNIKTEQGYPGAGVAESYSVKAHSGSLTKTITAAASESVLVALERAGFNPPAACRSGSCGVCRSLLLKGDLFIPEEVDERRAADKKFGFIHPCISYPLSDLEVIVPRKKKE